MQFTLQYGRTDDSRDFGSLALDDRYFIDDRLHGTAAEVDVIQAQNWKEAREIVADKHYM